MNSQKKSILIVGYGWLGQFLAEIFLTNGHHVTGITRNPNKAHDLENRGGKALNLTLTSETDFGELPHFDFAIIALPSGTRSGRGQDFPPIIKNISQQLQTIVGKWTLISSTSVYPKSSGYFSEDDATGHDESSRILLESEKIVREADGNALIIRPSGLFGGDRHPVRYLAGRQNISDGDSPVNLISGKDVAFAVNALLFEHQVSGIFNVSSPSHPSKKEYYTQKAVEMNLAPPTFLSGGADRKVNVGKLYSIIGEREFDI